ncbi:hypothetical protein BDN70DRAFT_413882 [Pholiota conissans]|uniref:Uncharacterized protein n=1 Tax=Pholiota conissans TaxID=109636 RepID=A0A9P5YQU3_9AGAR|nr:hypothetical protein BDN70DRAFT_413882 [Pholiota conissans]
MSFFPNAHRPIIEGGRFTSVQGDAHFHVGDENARTHRGLDILHRHVAASAFYERPNESIPRNATLRHDLPSSQTSRSGFEAQKAASRSSFGYTVQLVRESLRSHKQSQRPSQRRDS